MKKILRLKDVLNLVQNKTNKQYSYNLKKKELQHLGISPKAVLDFRIPMKDLKKKKEERKFW